MRGRPFSLPTGNHRAPTLNLSSRGRLTLVFSLFFLSGASDLYLFYIISMIYGFAYAGVPPVMLSMPGSHFGIKSVGSIIGMVNFAYLLGIAVGPLLGGVIFDMTGSYSTTFISAGIALGVSFLLLLMMKKPYKD